MKVKHIKNSLKLLAVIQLIYLSAFISAQQPNTEQKNIQDRDKNENTSTDSEEVSINKSKQTQTVKITKEQFKQIVTDIEEVLTTDYSKDEKERLDDEELIKIKSFLKKVIETKPEISSLLNQGQNLQIQGYLNNIMNDQTTQVDRGYNLTLNYLHISKYILEKEPSNTFDFFNCGLRQLIENPYSTLTNDFIHNLIKDWHKAQTLGKSDKEPLAVCYFDEEFLDSLQSKLKARTNFSRVYSGHDNIIFASRLLTWLHSVGFEIKDHIYPIQVLSNLFDVGVTKMVRDSTLNPQKDNDIDYTGDLSQYSVYKNTVFYNHLINIHIAYVKNYQKKYDNSDVFSSEKVDLPSRKLISWENIYDQLSKNLNLNSYKDFDSQIMSNFLLKCSNRVLLQNKFNGFNFEDIMPEDPLSPYSTLKNVTKLEYAHDHITVEYKRDILLRIFYPENYLEYRKNLPVYNFGMSDVFSHIDYPNKASEDKFCFDCKQVLSLISKHVEVVYANYAKSRGIRAKDYIIYETTNRERVKNLKRKEEKKASREKSGDKSGVVSQVG